jgi:hypothetical protein
VGAPIRTTEWTSGGLRDDERTGLAVDSLAHLGARRGC